MAARLSPGGEDEGRTPSPSDRSARRRSAAPTSSTAGAATARAGWTAPSASGRRGSQVSPTSEEPEWIEDQADDADDEWRRASLSSHSSRSKDRRQSTNVSHAPPTLDQDDSFYEEDDSRQGENVLGGWHFAPLLIAIIPPLGAVLGGQADAWSDAILLVLASFWLYQFLRVPHDIYHAARTRRILHADAMSAEEEEEHASSEDSRHEGEARETYLESTQRRKERHLAAAELRKAEMVSLAALVMSPVAGAWLLTWLMEVFTDGNRYLNKFNIRLFMLASGIKPWSHALSLFRQRLLHLQEVVHYPSSRVEALNRRVARMESDLSTLRKLVATKSDVSLLREGIDLPLTQLTRNMRRYEKKEENLRLSAEDKFGLVESRLEDLLREVAINAELIEEERRERQRAVSLPASIFQALRFALGQRGQDQTYAYDGTGRSLAGSASLGITAHANDGSPVTSKAQSGAVLSSAPIEGPPGYSSPPRYGPAPPPTSASGHHGGALTVTSSMPQRSAPSAWTEEGMAYWLFLPINIPKTIIRGAMSYANGRVSAAGDVNYAQSYAALTNNQAASSQNGNSAMPHVGNVPQHHRLQATNSKPRQAYNGAKDARGPVQAASGPSHYTRRV